MSADAYPQIRLAPALIDETGVRVDELPGFVDSRLDAAGTAVRADRDRIGRDLHDLVIQRLFATGMGLHSVIRLIDVDADEAKTRVSRAVVELDATIRELRSTIYNLQAPLAGRPSVRAQVLDLADAATQQLGFVPSLRLDGLLDTLLSVEVAENVLATMREALSNAARHACARQVEVLIAVRDDHVRVRVQDDGRGMAQHGYRCGLRNLSVRAERLGGSLTVTSTIGAGTTVLWAVPLAPHHKAPAASTQHHEGDDAHRGDVRPAADLTRSQA